jgi:hypothetical protein
LKAKKLKAAIVVAKLDRLSHDVPLSPDATQRRCLEPSHGHARDVATSHCQMKQGTATDVGRNRRCSVTAARDVRPAPQGRGKFSAK